MCTGHTNSILCLQITLDGSCLSHRYTGLRWIVHTVWCHGGVFVWSSPTNLWMVKDVLIFSFCNLSFFGHGILLCALYLSRLETQESVGKSTSIVRTIKYGSYSSQGNRYLAPSSVALLILMVHRIISADRAVSTSYSHHHPKSL